MARILVMHGCCQHTSPAAMVMTDRIMMDIVDQRKFSGKLPIYELLGSRRGIVVSSSSSRSSTSSSSSSRSSSRSTSSSSSRY